MDVKKNYDFFEANFDELYKKYPDKFLVLKDEDVVKVFTSFEAAADFGLSNFGAGNFSVQQCVPEDKRLVFFANRVMFAGI